MAFGAATINDTGGLFEGAGRRIYSLFAAGLSQWPAVDIVSADRPFNLGDIP
jgi:hypothetical protein